MKPMQFKRNASRGTPLALVVAGGIALAIAGASSRGVHAQTAPPASPVTNFYGEADQDLDPPSFAPTTMTCGSLTVGSGLKLQKTEPAGGFVGFCLASRVPGDPPVACYAPSGTQKFDYADYFKPGGTTACSLPAGDAVQPQWLLQGNGEAGTLTRASQGTYRSVVTCVPHLTTGVTCGSSTEVRAAGACPCNTVPLAHSCCTAATHMAPSSDGQTAIANAMFSVQ